MKAMVAELSVHHWPYGLELKTSAHGLLLRPRRKARVGWTKTFHRPRPLQDELASTRQLKSDFDAKEWQW